MGIIYTRNGKKQRKRVEYPYETGIGYRLIHQVDGPTPQGEEEYEEELRGKRVHAFFIIIRRYNKY